MSRLLQFRRGTAAEWELANPTLEEGEPGFETDTGQLKFGDGSAAWVDLAYSTDTAAGLAIAVAAADATTKANAAAAAAESHADTADTAHMAAGDPHTGYQKESERAQASGYASLDSSGKVPTAQLPALAITDTFAAASQAAMLALTAEVGDVCVRSDQNKSYILKTADPSVLAHWQELLTPTDTVLSVDGRTGAVDLSDRYDAAGAAATAITTAEAYADTGDAAKLAKASNLSDLANASTARTNLGLGTAATHATGDYDAAGAAATAQAAAIAAAATDTDNDVAAHEAAGDPHPTYETAAETAALILAHEVDTTNIHGIADTAVLLTTAHNSASDPHADRAYADTGDALKLAKASNLSDLANAGTARTNLGLGTAATHATGDYDASGAAVAAASAALATAEGYTDTAVALRLLKASDLSDLHDAPTARTNLGLGTAATKDVASSGDAASGQVVKGSDTRLTDNRTPVSHVHVEADVTSLVTDLGLKTAKASNLSDLGSASTARTNLGLGTSAVLDVPSSGDATSGQVVKGSDTRLSDSRAPTAHGASLHTDITRKVYVPSPGTGIWTMDSGTPNTRGAAPDATRVTTLADAATQGAFTDWALPADAKAATALSIILAWAPVSTDASAHTVRWSIDALVLAAGISVSAAGTTTTQTGDSAARTAGLLVVESAFQILASTSADDIIRLNIRRVGADAADTYVGSVDLVGIWLVYTAVQ